MIAIAISISCKSYVFDRYKGNGIKEESLGRKVRECTCAVSHINCIDMNLFYLQAEATAGKTLWKEVVSGEEVETQRREERHSTFPFPHLTSQ